MSSRPTTPKFRVPFDISGARYLDEPRTNLIRNPSVETDLTDWEQALTLATSNEWERSTDWAEAGDYSIYAKATATANDALHEVRPPFNGAQWPSPIIGGTTYTFAVDLNVLQAANGAQLNIVWFTAGGGYISEVSSVAAATLGEWRATVTGVAPPAATQAWPRLLVPMSNGMVSELYVDAAQFRDEDEAGDYFDGDTDQGTDWNGSAHASTSTRLWIPAGASRAAEVEQDTRDEVFQCVEAILRTPVGSRLDEPEFGIPDLTFRRGSEAREDVIAAINEWEPRAVHSLEQEELDELITVNIDMREEN